MLGARRIEQPDRVRKRIVIGLIIAIVILLILLIPFIEFVDLGSIAAISIWIHWPLFIIGFFGDNDVGFIIFAIIWYGVIIGFITAIVNYLIQIITDKTPD